MTSLKPLFAPKLWTVLLASAAAVSLAGQAAALPQGPSVAGSTAGSGGATFASTTNTLTVNQTTSRVVIDWTSFNIANGETVTFNQAAANWIAFNRVNINPLTGLSPVSNISGALNAQGGVWLFSTGGVIIGSTARVNVGSFALVTGPLANNNDITPLLFPDSSGLTTVGVDPPTGVGVEVITVQNGAQINATSGYVVMQGETQTQGGAITAADGVGYSVAETGQIQFTTSPTGQQLQSAGVTLLVGQDRPSFTHTGSTNALWVGIDTPGGTLQAGYHTLINVGGSITASGVKPDGSDKGVVLLVGGNLGPDYPGYTGSSIGVDASGATINAANGLYISTDSAKLGAATLGGPLDVETYGDITVTGPVSVAGAAQLNSATGALAINADVTSQQIVSLGGDTISVGPGVTVRSDALGQSNGGILASAASDFTADPTSLLAAGAVGAAPTDNVTINAGTGGSGNVALGRVTGVDVFAQTYSDDTAGRGAVTLAGDVTGTRSVSVFINDNSTDHAAGGDLKIMANVASAGFVDIENASTGNLVIGPGAAVSSSGSQVFLYDDANTTVSAGASVTGASLLSYTGGALTVASGASLKTTGAPLASPAAPVLPYGADFARASGLNLAAGTMTLQGTVTAGSVTAPDDIYIQVLNTSAAAVIGGAGGGSGFNLSNASFGQLSGRNIIIMGGPGEASGPGVDLDVQDLTLNSAKLSSLWLGTASSRKIDVTGAVTVTGASPVSLQLGFVRQGLGGAGQGTGGGPLVNPDPGALDGFIPGEIDISGSLGTVTNPLGSVSMIARNNIFLGTSGFIAAASADPAFDAVQSSADFPGADGHVFVAAQRLQLSAQGRIIQQNTTAFPYAGLAIGAPSATQPLIAAPSALNGKVIGDDAWTANFAAGPTRVDLFGVVTPTNGAAVSGVDAARLGGLLDTAIGGSDAYRINSCVFGSGCVPLTTSIVFIPPPTVEEITQATASATPVTVTQASVVEEVSSYAGIGDDFDSDRLGSINPVTESGNRELWTSRHKRRQP